MQPHQAKSCLVVGAGLCGLSAAKVLSEAGVRVVVLDASREIGGRMATRRLSCADGTDAIFDYGAQFFTTRSPEFGAAVERWQQNQAAREWFRGAPLADSNGGSSNGGSSTDDRQHTEHYPRYCGTRGMAEIVQLLARDIAARLNVELRLNERVLHLTAQNLTAQTERPAPTAGWCVTTQNTAFSVDAVLLTPPMPQTLALLQRSNIALPATMTAQLQTVTYEPCIAVLALLDGDSRIPPPGALRFADGPVAWLADNYRKGISPRPGSLTLHANARFSREHWTDDDTALAKVLLESVQDWFKAAVIASEVQRWHDSKAAATHPADYVFIEAPHPLALAGDGFGGANGAKIEGAFLSGQAAARRLLDVL